MDAHKAVVGERVMEPAAAMELSDGHRDNGRPGMPTIQYIRHEALSDRVTQFTFSAAFRHAAGQYLALSANIDGSSTKRYYSIASPPNPDGTIQLCIQHEGEFGRHLLGLRTRESVECSDPAGTMRLLDSGRSGVYFAAGTGIAPMRAILLEHLAANPDADVTLVEGARQARDLLYCSEFDALDSRRSGFRFVPVVSGNDPQWAGLRGRVTDHVDNALAGRTDIDAYFCGQPEMVSALREQLTAAGIPEDRQSFERY